MEKKVIITKGGLGAVKNIIDCINVYEINAENNEELQGELTKAFAALGTIDPKKIAKAEVLTKKLGTPEHDLNKLIHEERKALADKRNVSFDDIQVIIDYLNQHGLKAVFKQTQKYTVDRFTNKTALVEMNFTHSSIAGIRNAVASKFVDPMMLDDIVGDSVVALEASVMENALSEEILTLKVVSAAYSTNAIGGRYDLHTWLLHFTLVKDVLTPVSVIIGQTSEEDVLNNLL